MKFMAICSSKNMLLQNQARVMTQSVRDGCKMKAEVPGFHPPFSCPMSNIMLFSKSNFSVPVSNLVEMVVLKGANDRNHLDSVAVYAIWLSLAFPI